MAPSAFINNEEVTNMFPRLFSPVRIGGLEIKNRVAMTAMGVNLAAAGGGVNDDIIAFYEARARGGVGLIISGLCRVMDGAGAAEPCQLAARNPRTCGGSGGSWTRCTSMARGCSSSCTTPDGRAASWLEARSPSLPRRW